MQSKGIVTAAGLLLFFAFTPLSARADALMQGFIAERSSASVGQGFEIKAHVEEVTCQNTQTLNSSVAKPDADVPYLLGMPDTSRTVGFSISSFHRGPSVGLVKPGSGVSTAIQNPEPTSMLLLGTGLTALGAIARKRIRRRRK